MYAWKLAKRVGKTGSHFSSSSYTPHFHFCRWAVPVPPVDAFTPSLFSSSPTLHVRYLFPCLQVLVLQRWYRCRSIRHKYKGCIASAVMIQKRVRGMQARDFRLLQEVAAIIIQRYCVHAMHHHVCWRSFASALRVHAAGGWCVFCGGGVETPSFFSCQPATHRVSGVLGSTLLGVARRPTRGDCTAVVVSPIQQPYRCRLGVCRHTALFPFCF